MAAPWWLTTKYNFDPEQGSSQALYDATTGRRVYQDASGRYAYELPKAAEWGMQGDGTFGWSGGAEGQYVPDSLLNSQIQNAQVLPDAGPNGATLVRLPDGTTTYATQLGGDAGDYSKLFEGIVPGTGYAQQAGQGAPKTQIVQGSDGNRYAALPSDAKFYAPRPDNSGFGSLLMKDFAPIAMAALPFSGVGSALTKTFGDIGGRAILNAGTSLLTGGDPVRGAISGAAGGVIGGADIPAGIKPLLTTAASTAINGGSPQSAAMSLLGQGVKAFSGMGGSPQDSPGWTSSGDLPANEEDRFKEWITQTPWYSEFTKQYGEAPDLNAKEYDYRAAWKAGVTPTPDPYDNNRYHWPSSTDDGTMLKSADHPTAWKEMYMRATGLNPDAVGATKEQWNSMQQNLPADSGAKMDIYGNSGGWTPDYSTNSLQSLWPTSGFVQSPSPVAGTPADNYMNFGSLYDYGGNAPMGGTYNFNTGGYDAGTPTPNPDPGVLGYIKQALGIGAAAGAGGGGGGGAPSAGLLGGLLGGGNGGLLLPLLGGLLGGMSGGAKPAGTTTTINDIPDWQKPYVTNAFGAAGNALNDANAAYAATKPTTDLATNNLNATIRGDFLGSNPALDGMFKTASDAVANKVNSQFSAAGRYGSGAQTSTLTEGLGNLANTIYGQNYQQERQRQFAGSLAAPSYSQGTTQAAYGPATGYANIVRQPVGSTQSSPYFTNPLGGAVSGLLGGYALSRA